MVAWTGVCLLVLVAPFEALHPIVRLPGQSLTIVELALLAVLTAWLAAALLFRQRPPLRTPLTLPWVMVLLTSAVAAAVAPVDRTNAFHMVARFGLAFGVFLVTVSGISTPDRLRRVVVSAAVVGVAISVLVMLEFLGNGFVLRTLRIFRPGIAVVGSQVRAAGPFQYPTIASMYLEIVFAFTLGLLPDAVVEKRWWVVAAVIAVLAVIAEGIVLTFTRAGLLTLTAGVLLVGAIRYRRGGFDTATWAVALIGLVVAVEIVTSRSADVLRLRMTTESQDNWYRGGNRCTAHPGAEDGSRVVCADPGDEQRLPDVGSCSPIPISCVVSLAARRRRSRRRVGRDADVVPRARPARWHGRVAGECSSAR